MKILLKNIIEKAKSLNDENYYNDVVGQGTIVKDYLEISQENYLALVKKYNPNIKDPIVYNESKCCSKVKQMPSLMQQINNAVGAAGRVVGNITYGEKIKATEEEIASRRNICENCPFLDTVRNKCSKCGCFYKLKITLATEHCPENKW